MTELHLIVMPPKVNRVTAMKKRTTDQQGGQMLDPEEANKLANANMVGSSCYSSPGH